ncbi:MAG: radical SAM protein [Elusimicrobia bacterium]|nr:radical SAM protein [Elusimicrobiota bacterium]
MKNITTIDAIKKYNWPYYKTKVCELTLTYRCNAKCLFCYTPEENTSLHTKNEIDIKMAGRYILDSYKSGSRIIQIIGGEPTVYPELAEIIKIASRIGYPVIQIVTNGQMLKDFNYIRMLKDAGLNTITFSIHSDNNKIHDKIVGINGAFNNIMMAIYNAIKLDIYITVGTAINALNYKRIPHIAKFIYENFGIETFHFIALHFIGKAGKKSKELKVSYDETLPYLKEALNYLSTKKILPISPILSNYQPCILPGFEHLITDWKIPFNDDDLYLPETIYKEKMYTMITNTLRMKGNNCKKCLYYKICAGFEKKYFETYGDEEFKPLKSISKPFKIGVFYER